MARSRPHCTRVPPNRKQWAMQRSSKPPKISSCCRLAISAWVPLFGVSLRDLTDQLRPGHVDRTVDGTGLQSRVVFQNFDHQACIIRNDHAGLQHGQETDLSFGLAERSGSIDGDIGVKTLANGGHRWKRCANFE